MSPFEEDDIAVEACFDVLFAGPKPRRNLPDLLWRKESKIVDAINRGYNGREVWSIFKQRLPWFAYSYRSFAKALADFRRAKGLPPAYGARKREAAVPPPVLMTAIPTVEQVMVPQPVPKAVSPPAVPVMPPTEGWEQGEELDSATARDPAVAAGIRAMLARKYPPKSYLDCDPDTIEKMRKEDLKRREARVDAQAEVEASEAAQRLRRPGLQS